MNEEKQRIAERAQQLVESHTKLMEDLISLRKQREGLSQTTLGERMGVSQPAIAALESYDANPTLSTIRRYALAIGARIEYQVVDDLAVVESAELGVQQAQEWLAQQSMNAQILSINSLNINLKVQANA